MLQRVLEYSQLYNFLNWFFRRHAPEPGVIVLTQRRVYVLPTRQGIIFAIALLLMLTGSINYNLSLGYVLTFLLAGMGVVSILHTFRNLAQLAISAGRVDAVFAGDTARFHILLENSGRHDRYSLALFCRGTDAEHAAMVDIPAGLIVEAQVPLHAERRGWLQLERITIETRYPLGLTRAWSYVQPDVRTLAWPTPDDAPLPLPTARPDAGDALSTGAGSDDFFGLRNYTPSDSPRHVAWKASARGEEPLTKVFTGRAASEMWFDYEDNNLAVLDREARLSRLTRWVMLATRDGIRYGLKLPGVEVPLGEGESQREQCLRELALFESSAAPHGQDSAPLEPERTSERTSGRT